MAPRATSSKKARGQPAKKKRCITSEIGELVLDSDTDRPSTRKRKPNEARRQQKELEHSSTWFKKSVADDLWMPEKMELESVNKPTRSRKPRRARRKYRKHWNKGKPGNHWERPKRGKGRRRTKYVREQVPDRYRAVEPLLTSWFEVDNFIDEYRPQPWRTASMPAAPVSREIVDEFKELGVSYGSPTIL